MSFRVQMDTRDFTKQLDSAVRDGMEQLARDHARMVDSLIRRYRGQPVEEIKPVLRREWNQVNGGTISEPELTEFAAAISNGTRVEFRNGGIK